MGTPGIVMKMTAQKVTNYYPRRHSIPRVDGSKAAVLVGPQEDDPGFRRTHRGASISVAIRP